jgi:hypothetical protein
MKNKKTLSFDKVLKLADEFSLLFEFFVIGRN